MHTLMQLRSGALQGVTSLRLSEGLTHFPEEIFELADTLEVLDLSGNKLSQLPQDFGRLHQLKILFCSDNLFTELPEVLGQCAMLDIVGFKANKIISVPARSINPNIRWLILTDNCITALPEVIGKCARLQKLMLAGNKLVGLPDALSNCINLCLLRISANELRQLPIWLLSMPRLSWLAFSGNIFGVNGETDIIPTIQWGELAVSEVLGEGASGIIYKAVLVSAVKDVAVKVFKGAATSDGLPEDEMRTFIAAGTHAGLVKIAGQIAGHPDGKMGVVMELIPSEYYNLGLPPTFATCTRDVFAAGMQLSVGQMLRIAATMASVAHQLHSRGIMHGDLYAHNILVDALGNALLGDFGAASVYDRSNTELAFALERIEVSAFGYLLDDMLQLCVQCDDEYVMAALQQLRNVCTDAVVMSRPDFGYVSNMLNRMMSG